MTDYFAPHARGSRSEYSPGAFAMAGGTLLLWSAAAPAAVIYSGLLNVQMPDPANLPSLSPSYYDLNIGSTTEFRVKIASGSGGPSGTSGIVVAVEPQASNFVLTPAGTDTGFAIARPFADGALIDGSADIVTDMFAKTTDISGFEEGYYGLDFFMGGASYYGWVNVRDFHFFDFEYSPGQVFQIPTLTLVDWAYQDQADTGIQAGEGRQPAVPEPSTIALLALGAAGLAAWRQRKEAH